MKKILSLFIAAMFICLAGFGQAPGIFNYQGVARNSVGNVLVNQNISLRLSIHDGTATGPVVYSETRAMTTNPFGLFNAQVGSPGATGTTGTIAGVNWAVGNKFIQVEIDPNGGSSFINVGTAQLASVPYAIFAQTSGDIVLPFNKTQADAGTLFKITNSGTGTSIEGLTNSTLANANAIVGTVTSTGPGGFSAGVRGINNGTGGLGIGVYGSQAGSGWGVYGTAVGGVGVNGNASGGVGVNGTSNTGTGGRFTSTSGVALNSSGAVRLEGIGEANNFILKTDALGNASWTDPLLLLPGANLWTRVGTNLFNTNLGDNVGIGTNTPAHRLNVIATTGNAIRATLGATPATSIATQGSIYGESNTGIGLIGVSGSQNGVYGLSTGTLGGTVGVNTGSGNGLWGVNTQTGRAGLFEITNASSTSPGVTLNSDGIGSGIEVKLNSPGNGARGIDVDHGGVGPGVFATSAGNAVWGITTSISSAGVIGDNTFGEAVVGRNRGGNGVGAVVGRNDSTGYGVRGFNTKNGIGVLGQTGISGGAGTAGRFENVNAANTNQTVIVATNGIGGGILVDMPNASNGARGIDVNQDGVGPGVFSTSQGGNAVWGITSSISAAGVIGDNTFGEAVVGRNRGGNGVGAVVGRNDSTGYGVRGFNTKNGIGVLGQTGISGGTGNAGRFENVNAVNGNDVMIVAGNGTGNSLVVNNTNGGATNLAVFRKSGGNVARIADNGQIFANGGFTTGGADVAEYFDAEGDRNSYEAGDVLVISESSDRKVEKSSAPYSTLVSGVYATKPGITLTEENAVDSDLSRMVPMGVIGVIPTKVCLEGGAIKRGDLLVTSSISGVAMKADPKKVQVGQVIGKALQNYDADTIGKINVLVSIK